MIYKSDGLRKPIILMLVFSIIIHDYFTSNII